MKDKINQLSEKKWDEGLNSDIYTRFRAGFDRMLLLSDAIRGNPQASGLYVHVSNFEKDMESVFHDMEFTTSMVIGYAGVGKSTSLRYVFEFSNSAPRIIRDGRVLVFPAIFNGYLEDDSVENDQADKWDAKGELTSRIESVCTYLETEFPILRERFVSPKGQKDIYDYIRETNPKALENIPNSLKRKLTIEEIREKELDIAYEKEQFVCAVTKLKYYLGQEECTCDRMIVILDDIEPLPYIIQKKLVLQYVKFLNCMQNKSDIIATCPYICNLIISMRPHTCRILNEDRHFKAYSVARKIYKKEIPNIKDLLDKKIKSFYGQIPHENEDEWNTACRVLNILFSKFEGQYLKTIMNLNLWNIRDVLNTVTDVLKDRVWIQRDVNKKAYFKIREGYYLFNNITVTRAISCQNRYLYAPEADTIVPNILWNTPDTNDYCFISLCIFSLFDANKDIEFKYGENFLTVDSIFDFFDEGFSDYPSLHPMVEQVIQKLFSNKILRKSINDTYECENEEEHKLDIGAMLYLSPRGKEIYHMIGSDSNYFELCREDFYRDYHDSNNIQKSSFELLREGNQEKIFIDLFLLLMELLETEEKFIQYALNRDRVHFYCNRFSNNVKFEHFYKGIHNSIVYSGCEGDYDISYWNNEVEKKIAAVKNMLK